MNMIMKSGLGLSLALWFPGVGLLAAEVKDIDAALTSLLTHKPEIDSMMQIHQKNLHQASAKHQPWSASFWPDLEGNIANDYRESPATWWINFGLKDANRGQRRFDRIKAEVFNFRGNDVNQKLSPATKVDLVFGDRNFGITQGVLEEIKFRNEYKIRTVYKDGTEIRSEVFEGVDNQVSSDDIRERTFSNVLGQYFGKSRLLAYWSGICDGWGPASTYLPRPIKPVTVMSRTGVPVTFYPDDIKALGAYLFARTNTPFRTTMNYRFAGVPCKDRGQAEIDHWGYITDGRCSDVDAGLWHLALVNRIAVDGMGFVFDVDNNHKINNHPIAGYKFSYFNLKTGKESGARSAVIPIRELKFDGYRKARNPKTTHIVGVKSVVRYLNYQVPHELREKVRDSEADDKIKEIEYVYDLEMDGSGKILGGHWGDRSKETEDYGVSSSEQPDFIWMGAPGVLPESEFARFALRGQSSGPEKVKNGASRPFGRTQWAWDGQSPLPEDWVRAHITDARFEAPLIDPQTGRSELNAILRPAVPLSHFIYYLFDQARDPNHF